MSESPQVLGNEIAPDREILSVGDPVTFTGEKREYIVEKVEMASEVGKRFNLHIPRQIPVYFLKGMRPGSQGAYHPESDSIFIFENNTDEDTLEHELVHAIEWAKEKTPDLLALFEKVKSTISESSFPGEWFDFRFKKNVHEFIVAGSTSKVFIEALQKEGLYDDFIRETRYIFEG
jgi:hypothetical protein